ncbi:MAG: hypothetical protein ACM3VS_16590 [Candidatus Dadabacteria bacterium]
MEMTNNMEQKRRRKIIQKTPVLVRSVKAGQGHVGIWTKQSSSVNNLWK